MSDYQDFIAAKRKSIQPMGFDPVGELNKHLFDWQAFIVEWALRSGRCAMFEECGLGKTLQQLVWAEHVVRYTNEPVILHCPVGVRQQTKREADKFEIGVDVQVVNEGAECIKGINLVNYEKLHHFDPSAFAGVVLDESSILKNYTGKIKRRLIESYQQTPYRLACTATPAPNDHMELGTHAEFLGVCQREDMLSKYFVHDGSDTAKWRLRGHAVKHFWEWVATWAVCIGKPSDIGGSDEGFDLPPLQINRHIVSVDETDTIEGLLFNTSGLSATNIHEEKRLTCEARCRKAAELVNGEFAVIWCDTNYEADSLIDKIDNALEVRGTHKEKEKEDMLLAFSNGDSRRLITKPSVAGFGMNWQHCSHQIFSGLSYSFEAYYQAVRRCWRFGQERPVTIDIVMADSENAISSAVASKESDHLVMRTEMAEAMREATMRTIRKDSGKQMYQADNSTTVPSFLR